MVRNLNIRKLAAYDAGPLCRGGSGWEFPVPLRYRVRLTLQRNLLVKLNAG
jgi:hypothetical protein